MVYYLIKFNLFYRNNCTDSISADFTRLYSDKRNGYKDLKMIYSFSHFDRWRNNIVIVDDTKDVFHPKFHYLISM